jgi:hypothetical protein
VAALSSHLDPAHGIPDLGTGTAPAGTNAVGTLGVAASHYFSENLKLTAAYELPMTATVGDVEDPNDNLLTVQFQARF